MDFAEYQKKALETAIYPKIGDNLTYPILGLCGEVGEIANKFGKTIRDHDGKVTEEMRHALMSEIGDSLWFLSICCVELNCNLDDVAQQNIEKLASRMERNVINGSGDIR